VAGRLIFWDYDRVSLPYLVLCGLLLAILLLVPSAWWGDPMVVSL
jgi:hypothetical protein